MAASISQIRHAARIRKVMTKLPDAAMRQDFLVSLDDPFVSSDTKTLNEIEQVVLDTLAALKPTTHETVFASQEAAVKYLREAVFPAVSKNFRLFKTAKLAQDEYIVVNRDWLLGNDNFQSYATDRDVNDRLQAAGIPTQVMHYPFEGAKSPKKLSVLSAWRQQAETQAGRINTLEYVPGAADIVGHAFNTFKDVSVPAMEGIDVSPFITHMHDNLCNGNAAYFEYLTRWLAHMVQKPAERPLTGISIIGGQGTGKGIFIDVIARMLGGRRNANTTTSAKDTKSFNTAIGSKLLVVFDEATFSHDHEQSDFMKKLVTEPFVRIEPKGIDAYEVQNFARCFITSNNMDSSTPADIGARRWLIIECKNDIDRDALTALATLVGNNGEDKPGAVKHFVNGVKQYFAGLDITEFNPQQLPDQDTGMSNKISNHWRQDPVYAFLVEWLRAPMLTFYRSAVESFDGVQTETERPIQWEDRVLFADVYAVFSDMSKEMRTQVIGKNRIGAELHRFGIELFSGAQNVRYIRLPSPGAMLGMLRKTSRFDKLVSAEQEALIREWGNAPAIEPMIAKLVEHRRKGALLPTKVLP